MRLLLLISLLFLLAGCHPEPDSLRIGSNRWPGYAPYYLADEKGWLRSTRVQLIEYPSATGVLRAFDNGLLDAAFVTLDEALRLASDGHDLQILLVADVSAGADVLYSRTGISRLDQLAGKRIGVENTALGAYFLSRILDLAGLQERQVSIVNLPVNEHASAMASGRIDAVVSFATEEQSIVASGAHRLLDSREMPDAIIDVMVVKRGRASSERVAQLSKLWFDSLEHWQANRSEDDIAIARRLGLSPAELAATLNGLRMGDSALNRELMQGGRLQAQLYMLESYMLQRRMLTRPPRHRLLAGCQGDSC